MDDQPFLEHVLNQANHKEGISTRVPVNHLRKVGGHIALKFCSQVLRDLGFFQPLECDLLAQMMDLQILLETLQWTLGKHDVHRPIGAKQHQLGRLPAPCERRDEIQSRKINPVEVFEDQHQRLLRTQCFQCFANLPNHAFTRGSEDFSTQCLSLIVFQEGWELNEPSGRSCCQSLDDRTGFRIASQLTKGFKHWIVGLFAAETLDTLPASNPYFDPADGLLMKRVN